MMRTVGVIFSALITFLVSSLALALVGDHYCDLDHNPDRRSRPVHDV